MNKDWEKYTKGKNYNNKLKPNYYDTVDANLEFFAGNQWPNLEISDAPKPVMNLIKRVITFFVSSMMSSKTTVRLEPLIYSEQTETQDPEMSEHKHASNIASSEIGNLFDKFGMDNRFRDMLFKTANMGDVAVHMWWDKTKKPYGGTLGKDIRGEIDFELVNGTNVYLGNANNPVISTTIQPYVLLSGRETVKKLKAEAKLWKSKQADDIETDTSYNVDQATDMGKIEIEGDNYGKATYILVYTYNTETETIWVSKCTEDIYMYKDIDTGLSYYPVAWNVWEKQENQYHGRAITTGLLDNQIFINKMFAFIMYWTMNNAFPKVIYDADKISGWDNRISAAIGLKNMNPGDSIHNAAGYMQPAQMSGIIVTFLELVISTTKEMLGLTDAWSGNSSPDNAKAIAITVQQSSVPLENPKANFYECVEDIGKIMVDMMGTYYGTRKIVIKNKGESKLEEYDFNQLKDIWLNVKCHVGASSYYSEIAQVQMLDNLLAMKDPLFQMIDYLEALPDNYKNEDLIDKLKTKIANTPPKEPEPQPPTISLSYAEMPTMAKIQALAKAGIKVQPQDMEMPVDEGEQQKQIDNQQEQQGQNDKYEKMAQFMQELPQEIQDQINQLPAEEQEKALLQIMQKSVKNSIPQQQTQE